MSDSPWSSSFPPSPPPRQHDIRIQDRCDSATFNAVPGDGVCIKQGGVTFDEFLAQLNPTDGGDNHWRFKPEQTHLNPGGHLEIVN